MCVRLLKQDETDIESEREREGGRRRDKGIDMQIDLRRPLQLENLGMPQFRGIYIFQCSFLSCTVFLCLLWVYIQYYTAFNEPYHKHRHHCYHHLQLQFCMVYVNANANL